MSTKQLQAPGSRNAWGRINLFVQTNPAIMSIVIAIVLIIATVVINPKGFNTVALGNILLLTILLSFAAAGQTIVLIGGGMDFGVGAVMSSTAILTTYTMRGQSGHFLQVFALALLIGAAVGLLNGFCAVKIGLPAMVVTMAIANIVTRMQYVLTQGILAGSASKLFTQTVIYRIGGVIPAIILYAAIIWPLTFFILNRSRFGKQLYLVGNNPVAARLSGGWPRRRSVAGRCPASVPCASSSWPAARCRGRTGSRRRTGTGPASARSARTAPRSA